jgi:hypothetical protein
MSDKLVAIVEKRNSEVEELKRMKSVGTLEHTLIFSKIAA